MSQAAARAGVRAYAQAFGDQSPSALPAAMQLWKTNTYTESPLALTHAGSTICAVVFRLAIVESHATPPTSRAIDRERVRDER